MTNNPSRIKQALKRIFSKYFTHVSQDTKLSLFECATHSRMVLDYVSVQNITILYNAVDEMSFVYNYTEGFTNWEGCLKGVYDKSIANSNIFPSHLYMITDGEPTTYVGLQGLPPSDNLSLNLKKAVEMSKRIQRHDTRVIPIGIGHGIAENALKMIAGPCRWKCIKGWHYLMIGSYDDLKRKMYNSFRGVENPKELLTNSRMRPAFMREDKDMFWAVIDPDGIVIDHRESSHSAIRLKDTTPVSDIFKQLGPFSERVFSNTLDGANKDELHYRVGGRSVNTRFSPIYFPGDDTSVLGGLVVSSAGESRIHDKKSHLGSGLCASDIYAGSGQISCTSSDFVVEHFDAVLADGNSSCTVGDVVLVNLTMTTMLVADMRYDIGVQIAVDGGDAITGTCVNTALMFISYANNTDLDLMSGHGPYDDEEQDDDNDVCGDADKTQGPIKLDLDNIMLLCTTNGSNMTVNVCISWRETSDNSTDPCFDADHTGADNPTSCQCETMIIGGVIPITPSTGTSLISTTSVVSSSSSSSMTTDTSWPTTAPTQTALTTTTASGTTTTPAPTTGSVGSTTTTGSSGSTTSPTPTTGSTVTTTTPTPTTGSTVATTTPTPTTGSSGSTTTPTPTTSTSGTMTLTTLPITTTVSTTASHWFSVCVGHIWLDSDADGVQSAEPDFEGISVKLTDNLNVMHFAQTDGDGNFLIPNVASGSGQLSITIPIGYVITTGSNPLILTIPNVNHAIDPIGLFPANGTTSLITTMPTGNMIDRLTAGEIVAIVIAIFIFVALLLFMCIGLYQTNVTFTERARMTVIDDRSDQTVPLFSNSAIMSNVVKRRININFKPGL